MVDYLAARTRRSPQAQSPGAGKGPTMDRAGKSQSAGTAARRPCQETATEAVFDQALLIF